MGVGVLRLDRQESARADMERERRVSHASPGKPRHQVGREMERRGGGRDRAGLGREHGLVVVGVPRVGRAPRGDIGRERHDARAAQQQLDRLVA